MNLSDIKPNSPRAIAYEKAKEKPGIEVRFQGEDGYRTVRYAKGSKGEEIFGTVISEPTPGHWYEKAVQDVTKISEDAAQGFRVKDEPEEQTNTVPCGGCGAIKNSERCIGCLHDFKDGESDWVHSVGKV